MIMLYVLTTDNKINYANARVILRGVDLQQLNSHIRKCNGNICNNTHSVLNEHIELSLVKIVRAARLVLFPICVNPSVRIFGIRLSEQYVCTVGFMNGNAVPQSRVQSIESRTAAVFVRKNPFISEVAQDNGLAAGAQRSAEHLDSLAAD